MLQSMRDNSKGLVAWILVGLLVLVFALSGAEMLFSNTNGQDTALTINGEKISEIDVSRAIAQQKQQFISRYGDAVPADFLTDENLREPAINSLKERTLLNQSATNVNLAVGDEYLNQIIRDIPAFQNADGVIDEGRYRQSLSRLGYTPASYKEGLTQDMITQQFANGIMGSNFITKTELDYMTALSFEARDFNYVTLEAESLLPTLTVTEEAIQNYYDANSEDFKQPETVSVESIELSVEDLAAKIELTQTQIEEQYEANTAAFVPVTERHAAHILIESENESNIELVQNALANGEDFNEIALKYSDDLGSKDIGGDLGISTGDAFPESFELALQSLSVGEISQPVETDAGTHFIQLLSENTKQAPSFEDEKLNIEQQVKQNIAETRFVELLEQLSDLTYNADSLAQVAQELDLPLEVSEPFSRSGGTQGVARIGAAVNAAFTDDVLKEGNASEVIELAPNKVIVVKVIEHKESFIKPLDAVSTDITALLKEQMALEQLAVQGDAIKTELAAGKTFAEIADARSLALNEVKKVGRLDTQTPKAILDFAFSVVKPSGDSASIEGFSEANAYTVVELLAVHPLPTDVPEEKRNEAISSMTALKGSLDFSAYQAKILAEAQIETD